jgi:hypothetical protein
MSAAFNRLPSLPSYEAAFKHHNTAAPIRGRAAELRPLARFTAGRRDADRFSIRLKSNPLQPDSPPSVECVLYKTPVITFHPDNTVTITPGTHYEPSSSTAAFIYNILPFCSASRSGGRIILTARTEDDQILKHSLAKGEEMTFYLNLGDRYYSMTPTNPEPQTTIVMDRATANNVRARYGEFYRYLKATISLRTEQTTSNAGIAQTIKTTIGELKGALPHKQESPSYWRFTVPTMGHITNKPALDAVEPHTNLTPVSRQFNTHEEWRAAVEEFLCLIMPNPDPHTQAHNFYTAFMHLLYWSSGSLYFGTFRPGPKDDGNAHYVNPDAVRKFADEIIFKYHSNEVFKRRPVKPGQAPGVKYNKWVDWTVV